MAELKTKENNSSVKDFLEKIKDEKKKKDCFILLKTFRKQTGKKEKMWGTSMIGFGKYHYESKRSSQKGDWPLTGFSPRKSNISIYLMDGVKNYPEELKKLGPYKNGVSCLYIKDLGSINIKILEKLIKKSYNNMKKIHS